MARFRVTSGPPPQVERTVFDIRELEELRLWKRGGLFYPFRLQQVPALVSRHNLQACADCEAQQRDEGIPESNAIDVVGARAANQIARDIVARRNRPPPSWSS
jgi:hypothetical protein